MKRKWLALCLVVVLLSTGAFTAAQKPAPAKPRDAGTSEARILGKQLEAQGESQRATLRQSEANLEQARGLLRALEGNRTEDERAEDIHISELKKLTQSLERKIAEARQVLRSPDDPIIVRLKQELAAVQDELKKRQAK
jgi:hypothetical protein